MMTGRPLSSPSFLEAVTPLGFSMNGTNAAYLSKRCGLLKWLHKLCVCFKSPRCLFGRLRPIPHQLGGGVREGTPCKPWCSRADKGSSVCWCWSPGDSPHKGQVKADRQLEVQLNGGTLVVASDGISDLNINLQQHTDAP